MGKFALFFRCHMSPAFSSLFGKLFCIKSCVWITSLMFVKANFGEKWIWIPGGCRVIWTQIRGFIPEWILSARHFYYGILLKIVQNSRFCLSKWSIVTEKNIKIDRWCLAVFECKVPKFLRKRQNVLILLFIYLKTLQFFELYYTIFGWKIEHCFQI